VQSAALWDLIKSMKRCFATLHAFYGFELLKCR
jgi:hypothetical protein